MNKDKAQIIINELLRQAQEDDSLPKCPRCGGYIPNDVTPGEYPGALSRWDNRTEVCSACGTEEAMMQIMGQSISPTSKDRPWVSQGISGLLYVAADGNYGDAYGMALVDTTGWDAADYERLDEATDEDRISVAEAIAKEKE